MLFGSEQNPKGPGWRRLRKVEKDLSGTRVNFMAPPLRQPIPCGFEAESQPNSFDLNDPSIYSLFGDFDSEKQIYDALIWRSGWNYTGRPILDGETLGHLIMALCVQELRDLPVNHSLFQRSEMIELAKRLHDVTDLGQHHDGHSEDRDPFDLTRYRWPNHLSPINCQWLDRNGREWLYFETQPLWDGPTKFYWLTPISHQRYIMAHFHVNRWLYNAGNPFREQRSPIDNYRELMENIMNTMVVDLSPTSKNEQQMLHTLAQDFPFYHCSEQLVDQAKHTLYMWSAKGYRNKSKPKDADHRAPKEEVAAFIDQRIQPRPLPGCLAIGPAFEQADLAPSSHEGRPNLKLAENK